MTREEVKNCVTCEWSKDGHSAGTEECHLCMWESQYKPKIGHWIDKDEKSAVCSCCNRNNILYGDFCKWCGAKMTGTQERRIYG